MPKPRPGSFRLKIWNTGTKTIKRIAWMVSFLDSSLPKDTDPVVDGAYLRLSPVSIEPGKGAELIETFDYYPTPTNNEAIAVITGVLFSDGTIWKRDLNPQ